VSGLFRSQPGFATGPIVCTSATRPSSPGDGWAIFETDTGKLLIYYADPPGSASAGWYPPWNLPWGFIDSAEITASQLGIGTSSTDITGLSVTFDAIDGRLYRYSFQADVAVSVADGAWVVQLTDASNNGLKRTTLGPANLASFTCTMLHKESGLSGSTTRKMRANKAVGTGTLDIHAASSFPGFLMVEDIGPS
jgi:hypothetical protein